MDSLSLKKALQDKKRVYGTMIVSPSPKWVKAVTKLGLDFVFIDTEHVPLGRETLSWMCHGYHYAGLAPVVRIPSPDPYQASMVLDGGAAGVLSPYIETAEEVKKLRGAVKMRPVKGKRQEDFLNQTQKPENEIEEYWNQTIAGNMLFINIESIPAIEALDDILSVPDIDGVIIGPHDLTCSLGIPEQYFHPRYEEAVETIIKKCRERDISAGIHFVYGNSREQEIRFIRMGANIVLHSGDIFAFQRNLRDEFSALKQAIGD